MPNKRRPRPALRWNYTGPKSPAWQARGGGSSSSGSGSGSVNLFGFESADDNADGDHGFQSLFEGKGPAGAFGRNYRRLRRELKREIWLSEEANRQLRKMIREEKARSMEGEEERGPSGGNDVEEVATHPRPLVSPKIHKAASTTPGDVAVWSLSSDGKENVFYVSLPITPDQVSVSSSAVVAVDSKKGDAYAFSSVAGDDGTLDAKPRSVTVLKGRKCASMRASASSDRWFAVLHDGSVLALELSPADGALGSRPLAARFVEVGSVRIPGEHVVEIQEFPGGYGVITKRGRLYTWGESIPLGHGKQKETFTGPQLVEGALKREKAVAFIARPPSHVLVLTASNRTFAWGDKANATGLSTDSVTSPKLVSSLGGLRPRAVFGGGAWTGVVNDEGDLYTFGSGKYLTLGNGAQKDVDTPSPVLFAGEGSDLIEKERVLVGEGTDRSLAVLTSYGYVYVCGMDYYSFAKGRDNTAYNSALRHVDGIKSFCVAMDACPRKLAVVVGEQPSIEIN